MELKLDLKDKKILFELEQDCRQSLQQVARKVGLSKEAVFHRMKNLEKSVIKKYVAKIDTYKICYQYYSMIIKFKGITPEIEEEFYHYVQQNNHVTWITTCSGYWDVNLTLFAENNYNLSLFLTLFLEKYSTIIAEKQLLIIFESHYFKRGFWIGKPSTAILCVSGEKKSSLEKTDIHLLQILSENARMPLVEIASQLHVNPKVVAYKIKKLEQQKIIQSYNILADFSQLGYKFYKVWFSLQNMNSLQWRKLLSFVHQISQVLWATKLMGYYDFSIELEVRDIAQFREILTAIQKEFSAHIKSHESLMIFEEKKLHFMPLRQ